MRRRISSALGGSNSKEMIVPVTLGAYMAAICSASRPVASLIVAVDPLPEASLVMPIAFLRLACAVRPEYAPRGSPAHPPGGQNFGELHRPNFGGPLACQVRRIQLPPGPPVVSLPSVRRTLSGGIIMMVATR